jgi:hypothetical protein
MTLRRLASILPRQSARSAIGLSISSDGFIGGAHLTEGVLFLDRYVLYCYGQVRVDSRLLSRLWRPAGRFNTELLGIFQVQPLPTFQLHRLATEDTADGSSAEKVI